MQMNIEEIRLDTLRNVRNSIEYKNKLLTNILEEKYKPYMESCKLVEKRTKNIQTEINHVHDVKLRFHQTSEHKQKATTSRTIQKNNTILHQIENVCLHSENNVECAKLPVLELELEKMYELQQELTNKNYQEIYDELMNLFDEIQSLNEFFEYTKKSVENKKSAGCIDKKLLSRNIHQYPCYQFNRKRILEIQLIESDGSDNDNDNHDNDRDVLDDSM